MAKKPLDKNIMIENARIAFRNFSGKEGKFNPAGRRNFCVLLEPDLAKVLISDRWNVKTLTPRDEADDPQPYLQVTVSYNNLPPKIVLVTSKNQSILDESTVVILDTAEIAKVDLIIRPYDWEVNGKKGIKAYVKTMFVTIVEDELELKYQNPPDTSDSFSSEDDD